MSHVDDGTLHAYLDGELAPVERARLEAHVAECPACRARLEEERALVERASQLLGLAQPPDRASPPPPLHQLRPAWRVRIPLAWAASVMLALGLGYYLGGTSFGTAPGVVGRDAITASDSAIPLDSMPAQSFAFADRATPAAAKAPARAPAEPRTQNQAAARPPVELADRPAAAARADSVGVAAGMVAMEPQAGLRPANPAQVPGAEVVTAQADADIAALRGRLVATEWPIIRREPARQILGADPVGIPGLALREIRRSPANDGVVLVEQQLDSATVIQLFQRRAVEQRAGRREAPRAAAPARQYAATERLARFMGPLRVEIAGPLTTDSLNKLLEQAQPLP